MHGTKVNVLVSAVALRIAGIIGPELVASLPVLEAASLRRTVTVLPPWRTKLVLPAVLLLRRIAALLAIALLAVALLVVAGVLLLARWRVTLTTGLRGTIGIAGHDEAWIKYQGLRE